MSQKSYLLLKATYLMYIYIYIHIERLILMYGEKIDNEGTPGKTDEL